MSEKIHHHNTYPANSSEVDNSQEREAQLDRFTHDAGHVAVEYYLHDNTERLALSSERYVKEALGKELGHDIGGKLRPSFTIAGRNVVFKNRLEFVELPNSVVTTVGSESKDLLDLMNLPKAKVTVVGSESKDPIRLTDIFKDSSYEDSHFSQAYTREAFDEAVADAIALDERIARTEAYNRQHGEHQDSPEKTLVVTNTPLGITEAAVLLGASHLAPVVEKMRVEDYSNPECQALIDSVIAATRVDDNGDAYLKSNTDGYPLVLAALTGDETASNILHSKMEGLHRIENDRVAAIQRQGQEELRRIESEGVEPVPLDKMYLIHSTAYPPTLNENGDVRLYPTGHYNKEIGRASIHFTVNSNVYPHAQAQDAWGADNTIIITPLNRTIDVNGKNPEVLEGVDTWYALNPGEALTLPSPIIISAVREGEELVSRDGNNINVLIKDNYTAEEQRIIKMMMQRYDTTKLDGVGDVGAKSLREAVVHMVLDEQGVTREYRDSPSQDGHGMSNGRLGRRVTAAGLKLGVKTGTHFFHKESMMEKAMNAMNAIGARGDIKFDPFGDGCMSSDLSYLGQASLQAERYAAIRGGYTEATPPNILDKSNEDEEIGF